ncbi:MAG: Gfo/Idh/MocA family oxidoreductase [Planctomycetes bacterium]|nr:Gfo/Idh/MocA family oxidoreductase [Planctomycetota bacterium]
MNHPSHSPLDRRAFVTRSAAIAGSVVGLAITGRAQTATAPLKLGLISAATYGLPGQERTPGSHHGTAFATTFNGWDEGKAKQIKGTFVKSGRRLEGGRVVKIWDPDKAAAGALADACGIETVADTPEQCSDGVDAVLIVDDGSGAHWKYAERSLRKGVPTFCDKPLAMTAREAAAVARLARESKTRFMSASSLRFVPDIIKLRDELPQLGEVHLASAVCGNQLIYYGIHALSMIYAVLGKGATSAINVGQPGCNIARLRFGADRDVVLMVAEKEKMRAGYQINLYGDKGWRSVTPDLKDLYAYLLEAFLDLVITGKERVPVEEEVEVIAALEAAKYSLELGREVMLSEVMRLERTYGRQQVRRQGNK